MLIEITNTQGIDLKDEKTHSSLYNLFCAFREGKHLIIADEEFLKKVSELKELGSLTCNTACSLISKSREYRQLKSIVDYYCVVDMKNTNPTPIQFLDDNNFFIVGYSHFNDSEKIQQTKLLCEDINDYKLYSQIVKFFRHTIKMQGIDVKLEICNGGGANTISNFEKIRSRKLFCICLLDSDKMHPKAGFGSTASKFNTKTDTPLCKHFVIEPHEIESLIPLKIIEECLMNKTISNTYIYSLEQVQAITNYRPETKLYFDHKDGFTVKKILEIENKYNDGFWKDTIANAPGLKKKGCISKLECKCTPPCVALPGFGTGLLEAGTKVIERMTHIKLNEAIPDILMTQWQGIGSKLFSWGCSPSNKTRTS
ncbi:hypothetical protein [Citrobacter portucalensis]|uniref:hypothetical protein n=1 Tax=Citrobacter portucalensis TaxID=1639133 RepID=UPI001BA6A53D|nr:hypothetical protein [Citrobacter portucalensis]